MRFVFAALHMSQKEDKFVLTANGGITMIGDKIHATYKLGRADVSAKESINVMPKYVEGTVIYESKNFITLMTKNYPTSINKFDVRLGLVSLIKKKGVL